MTKKPPVFNKSSTEKWFGFVAAIFLLALSVSYWPIWWLIGIGTLIFFFFWGEHARRAFWAGFTGVFIAWIFMAVFLSAPNAHVLVQRISVLFFVPHWSIMTLLTGLIGGIVGGLGALSGYHIKNLFVTKHSSVPS